jgi:hypothetical protein
MATHQLGKSRTLGANNNRLLLSGSSIDSLEDLRENASNIKRLKTIDLKLNSQHNGRSDKTDTTI